MAEQVGLPQTSGTTQILTSVFFTNKDTGTAVGGGSTILRTTNGGESWAQDPISSGMYFEDVYFTDANNGVAVGWGGVIIRTTNGGANWNEPGHLSKTLTHVCFTNSNVGIAVGLFGSVMKTTDGGATWNAKSSGAQANFYSVFFTNKDTGTAVGNAGRILHTTNGGSDWIIEINPNGKRIWIQGCSFSKGK